MYDRDDAVGRNFSPLALGCRIAMYLDYFNLQELPFSITPDPRFLYFSQRHKEALAHLIYSVSNRSGFVLLTGEVGTGKTTLCRTLLDQLPEQVDLALILNPRLTAVELVATICDELAISYPTGTSSMKVLVDALNNHLLKAHEDGRQTIVIIDEAQSLMPEVLEQIRLLTNLETTTVKLLQIFLIGQPELKKLLAREDLRQLSQRITARYHITPLSRQELGEYVAHRLKVAGCIRPLFTPEALKEIYSLTQGIPRLINKVCDRALLGAYGLGSGMVTLEIIREAAAEVLESPEMIPEERKIHWLPIGVAALALAVFVLAGVLYMQVRPPAPVTVAVAPVAEAVPAPPVETVAQPAVEKQPGPSPLPPPSPPPPEPAPLPTPPPPPEPAPVAPPPPEPAPMAPPPSPPPVVQEAPVAAVKQEPEPETITLASLVREHPSAFQVDTVFTKLLARWGKPAVGSRDEPFCQRAEKAGLNCLNLTGNWNTLRHYDRPAVLTLATPNHDKLYVLITRLYQDRVVVVVSGNEVTLPLTELEKWWFGTITLLWHHPFPAAPLLKEGVKRKEVAWVRERVNLALGIREEKGENSEEFDATLTNRLKRFQGANMLQMDGAVGPMTFFKLSAAESLAKGHPTLTPH